MRGKGSTPHEVCLTSNTTVKGCANGFCCCLASEVNLEGAIDSRDITYLCYGSRVIGVVNGTKLDCWIVMDEVIGLLFPHTEGSHGFSPVNRLPGICDNALFHQFCNTFGEEFCMNTEVLFR